MRRDFLSRISKALAFVFCLELCSSLLIAQQPGSATAAKAKSNLYEDDEVKIAIPAGWVRTSGEHPFLGSSISAADAKLILEKDGYILGLAFRTSHVSGVVGGRFGEAFAIPWLTAIPSLGQDQPSTCGLALKEIPQPAGRVLMFVNTVIDTANAKTRKECGIPRVFEEWFSPPGAPQAGKQVTTEKWFGGYFSNGDAGWFLGETTDSSTETCETKMYSLTTSAERPEQLPSPQNAHLESIIQESIDIVDSIQYKRCAPKAASPF